MAYGTITATTTPQQVPTGWAEVEYVSGSVPYIGTDSSVSSTTGMPMTLNGVLTAAPGSNQQLWLVTASGTADVRWATI